MQKRLPLLHLLFNNHPIGTTMAAVIIENRNRGTVSIENRNRGTVSVDQRAGVGKCLFSEAAVKSAIDERLGDCLIPDFEEPGLPFVMEGGRSAAFFDVGLELARKVANHSEEYKVGTLLKIGGAGAYYEQEIAASAISPNGIRVEEYAGSNIFVGIAGRIRWNDDEYYRVTSIHDCTNQDGTEVLYHVFTYERVYPNDMRTVTDLAKAAVSAIKRSLPDEATEAEIDAIIE